MYYLHNNKLPIHLNSVHIKYDNKLRNKHFYKIPFSKLRK